MSSFYSNNSQRFCDNPLQLLRYSSKLEVAPASSCLCIGFSHKILHLSLIEPKAIHFHAKSPWQPKRKLTLLLHRPGRDPDRVSCECDSLTRQVLNECHILQSSNPQSRILNVSVAFCNGSVHDAAATAVVVRLSIAAEAPVHGFLRLLLGGRANWLSIMMTGDNLPP